MYTKNEIGTNSSLRDTKGTLCTLSVLHNVIELLLMYLLNVLLEVLTSLYLSHRCSTWQSKNFKWCTQTECCLNVCYYIFWEKFSAQSKRKWSAAATIAELPQIGVKLNFLRLMIRQSNLPEQIVSKLQDYCSTILKVDSFILVGKSGSAGKVIFFHWTCSVL